MSKCGLCEGPTKTLLLQNNFMVNQPCLASNARQAHKSAMSKIHSAPDVYLLDAYSKAWFSHPAGVFGSIPSNLKAGEPMLRKATYYLIMRKAKENLPMIFFDNFEPINGEMQVLSSRYSQSTKRVCTTWVRLNWVSQADALISQEPCHVVAWNGVTDGKNNSEPNDFWFLHHVMVFDRYMQDEKVAKEQQYSLCSDPAKGMFRALLVQAAAHEACLACLMQLEKKASIPRQQVVHFFFVLCSIH